MRDTGIRVLPGPPAVPVQIIDVRDLASFALDRVAEGATGVFDVAARPVTLGEFDRIFAELAGSSGQTRWADPDFLRKQGYQPWTSFPLWLPPSHPSFGFFGAACTAARRHGMETRPLHETLAACLAERITGQPGPGDPHWAPDQQARRSLAVAFQRGEGTDHS
jgi:hypothetical protein